MAKRQALLFELLKEDDKSDRPKGFLNHLFRKKESFAKKDAVKANDQTPGNEETPAKVFSDDTSSNANLGSLGKTRLYLRLNIYSLVLATTAILVIFFCAYILGKSIGFREGTRQRSDLQLAEIQNNPVQTEVLDLFPEKKTQTPATILPTKKNNENTTLSSDILKNDSKISRKSGLNYLIIQIFELDAEPIARFAQKFLAERGIDSSIERSGRSYRLISAAGFESGDPQKDLFRAQIETIGQQFKQQHDAYGVSFKGCYFEKWK